MSGTLQTLVVYNDRMGCEAALPAFLKVVGGDAVVLHASQASGDSTPLDTGLLRSIHTVVMIGTYWVKTIAQDARAHPRVKFLVYCPNDARADVGDLPCNVSLVPGAQKSVREFLALCASQCALPISGVSALANFNAPALALVHDRLEGRNLMESQKLFTGLMNSPHPGLRTRSLTGRFEALFSGEVSYDEVMRCGETILESQLGIARERAINNSTVIELRDGSKAALVEATELINITHAEVKKAHPDVDATIAFRMDLNPHRSASCETEGAPREPRLGDLDVHVLWSLRSDTLDVSVLARSVGGDGKPGAAGGHTPHTLSVPF